MNINPNQAAFESTLTKTESKLIKSLTTPYLIQQFLDTVKYPSEDYNRSVLQVIRERKAHCLDGGLFAAAALRMIGYPALILDILPESGTDDDHILALFNVRGCWGAVAKSNFVGLRYREPVYKTIRELVMSYFEEYFNIQGNKTMRGITRPVQLAAYDKYGWMWDAHGVDVIEKQLKKRKVFPLITPEQAAALNPADQTIYQTGLSLANLDGLYKGN